MFQSSPDPKAGRYQCAGLQGQFDAVVPILTRPEGRALPELGGEGQCNKSMFQFLTRPEGRALPAGTAIIYGEVDVPILTRPEGRALPSISLERWGLFGCFPILTRPEGRALPLPAILSR